MMEAQSVGARRSVSTSLNELASRANSVLEMARALKRRIIGTPNPVPGVSTLDVPKPRASMLDQISETETAVAGIMQVLETLLKELEA